MHGCGRSRCQRRRDNCRLILRLTLDAVMFMWDTSIRNFFFKLKRKTVWAESEAGEAEVLVD